LLSNLNTNGYFPTFSLSSMFLFSQPSRENIEQFLQQRESDVFSYQEVGGTRAEPFPAGYDIDHNRVQLGRGVDDFDRAKKAIRGWQMFKVPGLELIHPDTRIEPGRNVALVAHHLGFHSL